MLGLILALKISGVGVLGKVLKELFWLSLDRLIFLIEVLTAEFLPVKRQANVSNIIFTTAKVRNRQEKLACLSEAKFKSLSGSPGSLGWQMLLV